MYIFKSLSNEFRFFANHEVVLDDGMKVIIGHNIAGKCCLPIAIGLLFRQDSPKRLEEYFSKNENLQELQANLPFVTINLDIIQIVAENKTATSKYACKEGF